MMDVQDTPKPIATRPAAGVQAPRTDAPPVAQPATMAPPAPAPGKGSRRGAIVVVLLIIASLTWYLFADRLTPYTSQARVQAFVVPVPAEVAGTVLKVYVKNNDEVRPGQPLFDIDPSQYRIALQRSRSDYESVRLSVNASVSTVAAARAALAAAIAGSTYAEQDAARMEQIYAQDPGAVSLRRVQSAQSTRLKAQSQVRAAEADLRRAIDVAGAEGERNAQIQSARAAVEKAELDLKRTTVLAPSGGSVTDLRTDVGQFAATGAPAMTLIAVHDLWINADMTENNLGHIKPGARAAIVLDVMPGEVLKGRVRSVGTGILSGKQAPPGTLPTVENSRDWLRQAQRFPVAIEFDPAERARLEGVRVGGQADVLVYTGDHPFLNWLAGIYITVMSWFSYFY